MENKKHLSWVLALVVLLLVGCAGPTTRRAGIDQSIVDAEREKQREIALERRLKQNKRLSKVTYPLLSAASGLCAKEDEPLRAGVGVLVRSKYSYDSDMQDTAARLFEIGAVPKVLYVVENSPAERAGVKVGDLILSVAGKQISSDEQAFKKLVDIYAHRVTPGEVVKLVLDSSGKRKTVEVKTDKHCHYVVALVDNGTVNAFADGSKVMITTGMMRFAETDEELSLVVSHEIAHNLMNHMDAKRTNAAGGMVLDILAAAAGVNTGGAFSQLAANVNSQGFEAEADYVGLYIMARAGLRLDKSANFWRRMAAEYPKSITSSHSASHPSTAERYVAIENTVQELEMKNAEMAVLIPEYDEKENSFKLPSSQGSMSILDE